MLSPVPPTSLPSARLLIVEDHPLYRDGLLGMLQRSAPQLQCRLADRGEQALAVLRAHPDIDLVLADQNLPGQNLPGYVDGMALLAQVGQEFPTAARVLISGSDDPHLPLQAQRAGLMGYLPKALEPMLWMNALSRILVGDPWFPPSAVQEPGPSERQAVILQRLAAGCGNKEIARELGITERTVKYHLAEVYGRLNAANRAEAVARASARGWLRLPVSR
jgi:two-component system, NarL family, nitrate/nitrite response regulator NarL